jgi:ribosomal protein L44E
MQSDQTLFVVLASIGLLAVGLAYLLRTRACPNCHRIGSKVERQRKLVDTELTRSISKKERNSVFRSPMRRFWEETVDKIVRIEEVGFSCKRCKHCWTETRRSRPSVHKVSRELDPRDWGFFDDNF